jgi:hypothetical protein
VNGSFNRVNGGLGAWLFKKLKFSILWRKKINTTPNAARLLVNGHEK